MADTLESLNRKREGAAELNAVVLTMKAMAASNIGQYEMAVTALKDYYIAITKGVTAWFASRKQPITPSLNTGVNGVKKICAIVFGTDQGLVGRFNDSLAEFVKEKMDLYPVEKIIWAVGDRIYVRLSDLGLPVEKLYTVPHSVTSITPLVDSILIYMEETREEGEIEKFYIFHNAPLGGAAYEPFQQRLLPLDEEWEKDLAEAGWATNNLPEVAGDRNRTFSALIREYLFVSLFKACAESLSSENASRLSAMQRAEKNISEMLDDLNQTYNRLRQSTIDEELFDVISGFEALKNKK